MMVYTTCIAGESEAPTQVHLQGMLRHSLKYKVGDLLAEGVEVM